MFWPTRSIADRDQRTAVVTGASRRVGLDIATHLTNQGWRVVIHGRNEEQTVNAKIRHSFEGAVVGDLANYETVETIGDAVDYFFNGDLDLLVNNASPFVTDGRSDQDHDASADRGLECAKWTYLLSRRMWGPLNEVGGLAINLTDESWITGWDDFIGHGMGKAAIEGMTQHMNHVWRRQGINAASTCLRLGMVLAPDGLDKAQKKSLYDRFGEPVGTDAVARAIVNLHGQKRGAHVSEITDKAGNIKGIV